MLSWPRDLSKTHWPKGSNLPNQTNHVICRQNQKTNPSKIPIVLSRRNQNQNAWFVMLRCRLSYSKIMQTECRTPSLLDCYAEVPLILWKDNDFIAAKSEKPWLFTQIWLYNRHLGKKSMFFYVCSALFQSKSPFPSSSSSMPNPMTLRLSALKGSIYWRLRICSVAASLPPLLCNFSSITYM